MIVDLWICFFFTFFYLYPCLKVVENVYLIRRRAVVGYISVHRAVRYKNMHPCATAKAKATRGRYFFDVRSTNSAEATLLSVNQKNSGTACCFALPSRLASTNRSTEPLHLQTDAWKTHF